MRKSLAKLGRSYKKIDVSFLEQMDFTKVEGVKQKEPSEYIKDVLVKRKFEKTRGLDSLF